MKIHELNKAINIIKKSSLNDYSVIKDLLNEIDNAIGYNRDKDDEINLIDRNKYIASILWCKDDILHILSENDIPLSDENVNKLLDKIDISGLEDCSYGWDVIEAAFNKIKWRCDN